MPDVKDPLLLDTDVLVDFLRGHPMLKGLTPPYTKNALRPGSSP